MSFFKQLDIIKVYLNKNKDYEKQCELNFIGQDYTKPLNIEKVDLIISQYGGFVGQATKQYLKVGGILLCNDSHGDATLAKYDNDFKFIGIVNKQNKIQKDHLENYFRLALGKVVDLKQVRKNMQGLKYTLIADNYLFRKVK